MENHFDDCFRLNAAQRSQFGLVQGEFEVAMRAENGHQIHNINIKITVRNLIHRVKVAFHHDGEVAATTLLLEQFL